MHNARHHSPPRLSRGGYCVRDPSALHRGPGRLSPATESSTKPTGPWCLSRGPLSQPERGDITVPAADASWQCCARSALLYEVDRKRGAVRAGNCSTTDSLAALGSQKSLLPALSRVACCCPSLTRIFPQVALFIHETNIYKSGEVLSNPTAPWCHWWHHSELGRAQLSIRGSFFVESNYEFK